MKKVIFLSLVVMALVFPAVMVIAGQTDFGSVNLNDDGATYKINGTSVISRTGLTVESANVTSAFSYNGTSIINSTTDHINASALSFTKPNIAASLGEWLAVAASNEVSVRSYVMPWAGSVVGISIAANAAVTSGGVTAEVLVNDVRTGFKTQITNGTGITQYNYSSQARDTDTFSAGGRIGITLESSAAFAPNTIDAVITVYGEH